MFGKLFDQIDSIDLEQLVADRVPEGRELEYKRELPGNADEDKREFLYDVTSLANASGGFLIYGIEEKRDENGKATGEPEVACGLSAFNEDETIR
jgi:predicted HTH transcriptional regulator